LTTGTASRPDSILISTCREIGISASGSSTTTTPTGPRLSKNDYGWSNAFGFKF
jgi:hypothetical protein